MCQRLDLTKSHLYAAKERVTNMRAIIDGYAIALEGTLEVFGIYLIKEEVETVSVELARHFGRTQGN